MTLANVSREFNRIADGLTRVFTLGDLEVQMLEVLERKDLLEQIGPEASGINAADLDAEMALVDRLMIEKCEGYVGVIRELEHMAESRKEEADRMAARAKTAQRHADWLTNRLKVHMQATGRERIELGKFTLTLRTNPPRVEVLEPSMVPSEYTRTKITVDVDKRAILEAYKRDGLLVPGTEVVRGTSLRVS